MSAQELADRLTQLSRDKSLDWDDAVGKIVAEHQASASTADRVVCLELLKTIADRLESDPSDGLDWVEFKKTRLKVYRTLLLTEAWEAGKSDTIDLTVVANIADREVAAGRLAPDDDLFFPEGLGRRARATEPWQQRLSKWIDRIFTIYP